MQDGGLGGSYFAVVDPGRGEVFYRQWAEASRITGDTVTLDFFREDDFDALISERGGQPEDPNRVIWPTKVRSYKQERIDLRKVLRNGVIFNKPSYLDDAGAEAKTRDVKIYLWDANGKGADIALTPVQRRVGAATPLRLSLEMLFAGPTAEEATRGLSSPTFGMKFEDVRLRNGVALVKFSQPLNQTNYGSQGPMILAAAIEKTARQFPTVKELRLCAIGETLIDSQLEKPFAKCSR